MHFVKCWEQLQEPNRVNERNSGYITHCDLIVNVEVANRWKSWAMILLTQYLGQSVFY